LIPALWQCMASATGSGFTTCASGCTCLRRSFPQSHSSFKRGNRTGVARQAKEESEE
jgi:hypothetical protein